MHSLLAMPPAHTAQDLRTHDMALRFYASRGNLPAWVGERRALAAQVLQHLGHAEQYGLAAEDYAVRTPFPDPDARAAEVARFDLALTSAALRFLSDLHSGRTAPEYEWYAGNRVADGFDPVTLLVAALEQAAFDAAISASEPKSALYSRVKRTLARYRKLEPAYSQLPPVATAADISQRLLLLGDMADGGTGSAGLEAGIRNFQARHGLAVDGVAGKETLSALSVPLSRRVRQLEFTLERLRWLPPLPPGPLIVVNVPAFRLWALDTRTSAGGAEVEMRVIVGNAARTPTPLLVAQLHHLEFNPAWNVPRSIEVQELIPKLARDPELLRKEDMELVPRTANAKASAQSPLESLRAGTMRLRQRPGPRNALGAVKFAMPNPLNIYLHATPAKALFSRSRRDLSHGCIRLEHPEELAAFALRDDERWSRSSILAAMEPGPSQTVTLKAPIPVLLLYATAITDRQGRAVFLPDAYGLDRKLAEALEAGRTRPGGGAGM
jgi:murein L,D-transpeptidase YcbB/YkuD